MADRGTIYGIQTLEELILACKDELSLAPLTQEPSLETPHYAYDFSEIHGQHAAKRALEIAAAGHHNILLSGPPGAGKTLLSRSLPSIMPPMTREELLEATQIHSIAGLLNDEKPLLTARPFRSPHHSASMVALIGGSNPPRPGEITLAHHGVLFLDEFAELPRHVIEALRQPLEDKIVTVARAGYSAEFPAHCMLIAAINPCPCGFKGDPQHPCTCYPQQILLYQKKLSGPILDRIDLHLTVPAVPVSELTQPTQAESSQSVRERVVAARHKQHERYKNLPVTCNSQLANKHIASYCILDDEAKQLLEQAIHKFRLSARSYHKVLKISRTIADLAAEEVITRPHIAEALQYRQQSTDA